MGRSALNVTIHLNEHVLARLQEAIELKAKQKEVKKA
jgi:hypothetical protein